MKIERTPKKIWSLVVALGQYLSLVVARLTSCTQAQAGRCCALSTVIKAERK